MTDIAPIPFGRIPGGGTARLYRLSNAHGTTAEVTDYGACLVSLRVPDGREGFVDVVMGYDGAAGYTVNAPHFGAVIGRFSNRIAGARFELDGTVYRLEANENGNSLHSGPAFWHHRLWSVGATRQGADGARIELSPASPDGDQGFPGAVTVRVAYELAENDELRISYEADAQARTPVNLTNHSYFNLNGHASGTVLDHTLSVAASAFTATDRALVPTGELVDVSGTPMDLRAGRTLREGVESGYPALEAAGGYDQNYAIDPHRADEPVATLVGDGTGIAMDVFTDMPGIQVYSGNFIGDETGKGGARYGNHEAVCLETQFFPDAVNQPAFEQPVFGPGRPCRTTTVYAFRTA